MFLPVMNEPTYCTASCVTVLKKSPKPSHFSTYHILTVQWPSHICFQLFIANSSLLSQNAEEGNNQMLTLAEKYYRIFYATQLTCSVFHKEISRRQWCISPQCYERQRVGISSIATVFSVSLKRYKSFLQLSDLKVSVCHHYSSQPCSANPSNVT